MYNKVTSVWSRPMHPDREPSQQFPAALGAFHLISRGGPFFFQKERKVLSWFKKKKKRTPTLAKKYVLLLFITFSASKICPENFLAPSALPITKYYFVLGQIDIKIP